MALELETRRRLYDAIRRHPGAHLRELDRLTGLGIGALRYHLEALVEARLVREEREGRLVRAFPADVPPELARVVAQLRARTSRLLIVRLLVAPGLSLREISADTRLAESTLRGYANRLVESGIVAREGTALRIADPALATRALLVYRPTLADRIVDAAMEIWQEETREE